MGRMRSPRFSLLKRNHFFLPYINEENFYGEGGFTLVSGKGFPVPVPAILASTGVFLCRNRPKTAENDVKVGAGKPFPAQCKITFIAGGAFSGKENQLSEVCFPSFRVN